MKINKKNALKVLQRYYKEMQSDGLNIGIGCDISHQSFVNLLVAYSEALKVYAGKTEQFYDSFSDPFVRACADANIQHSEFAKWFFTKTFKDTFHDEVVKELESFLKKKRLWKRFITYSEESGHSPEHYLETYVFPPTQIINYAFGWGIDREHSWERTHREWVRHISSKFNE